MLLNKNKKVKKIYAFEPDESNYKVCEQIAKKQLCDVELIRAGLWNKKTQLEFNAFSGTGSKIVKEGTTKINTVTIDEVTGDDAITFIKMDIEGAELEALCGAKQVIKKFKPTLAISVYHKPDDIIMIAEYIKSLVPEYQMYLRQYTNSEVDTVLYAIIKN